MTELAWIPPLRSGPSLGLLKAFLPARLNPQCLLSTSQRFLMILLALHVPQLLLSRRSHYYLKINAFLSSSFTKNIPSSSPFPQLLAQASAFREVTWANVQCFSGSGMAHTNTHTLTLWATQGSQTHTECAHHRTKLAVLWSYSFWRMVLSPFASERINLLAVR